MRYLISGLISVGNPPLFSKQSPTSKLMKFWIYFINLNERNEIPISLSSRYSCMAGEGIYKIYVIRKLYYVIKRSNSTIFTNDCSTEFRSIYFRFYLKGLYPDSRPISWSFRDRRSLMGNQQFWVLLFWANVRLFWLKSIFYKKILEKSVSSKKLAKTTPNF